MRLPVVVFHAVGGTLAIITPPRPNFERDTNLLKQPARSGMVKPASRFFYGNHFRAFDFARVDRNFFSETTRPFFPSSCPFS